MFNGRHLHKVNLIEIGLELFSKGDQYRRVFRCVDQLFRAAGHLPRSRLVQSYRG